MTNEQRIAEIRERLEKASPGPWSGVCRAYIAGEDINTIPRGDIKFLGNARKDIEFLLSRIEELERTREV